MSERARVVILNPDSREGDAWEHALAGTCELRRASDAATLALLLRDRHADVVVAPCDAAILDAVQRCRGHAGLVLCGAILPEGVIDAAGEGTDLRHVASPDRLRRAVLALARPRSPMARKRIPGLTVWISHPGFTPAAVLDISNRGFSFRLELDQQLESFLPGALLPSLAIRHEERVVLEATRAEVRYVEQAHDETGRAFYRIGCELPARSGEAIIPGRVARIDDAATLVGLLRLALRQGGILLQPADDESEALTCERGHVDLEQRILALKAIDAPFEPFEVVRGTFELGGSSYRFLSAVLSTEPFQLRLPGVIEATHRRTATRHRADPARPIFAKLASPLFEQQSQPQPVLDISATGFSFAIDPSNDLYPPGLRLSEVELTIGPVALRCRAEVRNLSGLSGSPGSLRCGVIFSGLSLEARGQLADALMRNRFPGLADAAEFPFEQLWAFLEETGFIYPKKLETLSALLPQVRETFQKLGTQTGHLFKAVVFHEERQLYAHISAVRSHSRSFVVQHLAATTRLHGRQGPRAVNLGITEFLAQDQHLDFGKIYYRPDNKWPARIFGGYARKVTDRQRSELRTYDYLLYPTNLELPETPGVRVIEAQAGDLGIVESHFVATERGLVLRSDDLTRSTITLEAVDDAYRSAGLFRRRTVLLAVRPDDTPVGFALCELSSPGLNLSELLSAMRLFILPAGEQAGPMAVAEIRSALFRESLALYRAADRPFVPLLKGQREPEPPATPRDRKQYSCWTGHRTLLRPFNESLNRMYEMLESSRDKRKSRGIASAPRAIP